MRRAAILLACLAALTTAPGARAQSVPAGSLTVETAADPFSLRFHQHGGSTLRMPPGALGFDAATGQVHSTRLVSARTEGGALIATIATDDPLGRTIDVRVTRGGEGVASVSARVTGGTAADITKMRIRFAAPRSERLDGLGARSIAGGQRGQGGGNHAPHRPLVQDTRPVVSAH